MSSAVQICIAVTGTKQGKFSDAGAVVAPNPAQPGISGLGNIRLRGSSSASQVQGQSPALTALKFSYGVTSPSDLSTGLPSGKRQHKPIVITREPSAASPQFFSALITNEALKVVIQFVRADVQGRPTVQQTITLTNALVSDFLQYMGDDGRWLEDVAFTFQKIEIVNTSSQKVAEDDWRAAVA